MMPRARNAVLNTLLVCVSLLVGYVAIEIGYRVFEYWELHRKLVNETILPRVPNDGQGDSTFDLDTGYRYRPNMEVGPRSSPFPLHYRTNSEGLIARENFPVQKPAGEFRIGVVGDSFTAGVMSTIRWTDIVEDSLNQSSVWRHIVGDRQTRVINFGLDGIGTVQFAPVVRKMVLPYDVNLLIVNMLEEDIVRRPYHRGYQTSFSEQQVDQYVENNLLAKLHWFGTYPEVLAVTVGRPLGMKPRLGMAAVGEAFWGDRLYATAAQATDAATASITEIRRRFPHAVFLLDPTYKEYTGAEDPMVTQAFDLLTAELPDVHWVIMADRLPKPATRAELDSWFNVPYDQHKNALGTKIYGEAVARYLVAVFQAQKPEP